MRILIRGARALDPGNLDGIADILIEDGKIAAVRLEKGDGGGKKPPEPAADRVVDVAGKLVTPGLIDMHVHLREPGHEYKETILTGGRAAVAGGFTAVCPMPNTNPVNDNRQVTEYMFRKAAEADLVRIYPVAAISQGLRGENISEYGELKDAGVVALSDDGRPVMDSQLMRRALEYAKGFGLPIIPHCEDLDLSADGVMNEGALATRMGLAGIPNAAESVMVMRDIALCELTEARLHIAHVSTADSVRAIRDAKSRGVPVTAETAPHYFSLTEAAVADYDTNAKMSPPLRSEKDRDAVLEGLSDGTIDVIATDHAPHSSIEKMVEFDLAANGIIGLETSLALGLGLVDEGAIDLTALVEKMSKNPARVLGLENGLQVGMPADMTVMDLDRSYTIDPGAFSSRSRNTPFAGCPLRGKAILTIVGGRIVYEDL